MTFITPKKMEVHDVMDEASLLEEIKDQLEYINSEYLQLDCKNL